MANKLHHYRVTVRWTGYKGVGTASHGAYERSHVISAAGKPAIDGSSDPSFRGDPSRWNPEELMLAAISACHKLWYLSLCAQAGVVVTGYEDDAEGTMVQEANGAGQFTGVTLHPRVTLRPGSDVEKAEALHHAAHKMCFIARSVNFPVEHRPTTTIA